MEILATINHNEIRKAKEEDCDDIFAYLSSSFFKEDPIVQQCGINRNEKAISELWNIIKGAIKENYSLVVTKGNQVSGVSIIVKHRKGFKFSNHYNFETEECQKFIDNCEKIEKDGNAFEKFNLEYYGEIFLFSSPPELHLQMMKMSLSVVANAKLKLFFVHCYTKEMKEAMEGLGGKFLSGKSMIVELLEDIN